MSTDPTAGERAEKRPRNVPASSAERTNHRHQRVESGDSLHARRLRVYAWRNVDIGSIRSQSIDCADV